MRRRRVDESSIPVVSVLFKSYLFLRNEQFPTVVNSEEHDIFSNFTMVVLISQTAFNRRYYLIMD